MDYKKTTHILAAITALSLALNLFVIGFGAAKSLAGDMDQNGTVDVDDAIYLLQHVLMPELFPLPGDDTGGDSNTGESGLSIGYSKINVMPNRSVGLAGYSDSESRRSEGFLDYIYITCIAATAGDETILLFTVDAYSVSDHMANQIRDAVRSKTDIAKDKIFIGATHSHSCPEWSSINSDAVQDLLYAAENAAVNALEDRSPATVFAGTQRIPNMNFVNHYMVADGSYAGANFGDFSTSIVGHATEADDQIALVKFDYADENKQDVLLVNWQAHPNSARELGYCFISADWVGYMRDELQELSGMRIAYFTGATGNLDRDSKIVSEAHNRDWRDYGTKMGQLANDALSGLQPATGEGIKTYQQYFTANIDHSWDHMIDEANEVYDLWKSAGKTAGDALAEAYGFSSVYQARAIRTRANMGATDELEINAFSIGGVGFTAGTYEMYSNQSIYIKEQSPFATTFIITGNNKVIPSSESYDYRAYDAETGYFARGTAEDLAKEYVDMLKELK